MTPRSNEEPTIYDESRAYRSILHEIATRPTVERNPDGDDQAAATMQLLAREVLAEWGLPAEPLHRSETEEQSPAVQEPEAREDTDARVDWSLTGMGEDNPAEVSGPGLPEDEIVGVVAVATRPCPDCGWGDSGCSTCGDHRVIADPPPVVTSVTRDPAPEEPKPRCPTCGSDDRFLVQGQCASDQYDPDRWHANRAPAPEEPVEATRITVDDLAAREDRPRGQVLDELVRCGVPIFRGRVSVTDWEARDPAPPSPATQPEGEGRTNELVDTADGLATRLCYQDCPDCHLANPHRVGRDCARCEKTAELIDRYLRARAALRAPAHPTPQPVSSGEARERVETLEWVATAAQNLRDEWPGTESRVGLWRALHALAHLTQDTEGSE